MKEYDILIKQQPVGSVFLYMLPYHTFVAVDKHRLLIDAKAAERARKNCHGKDTNPRHERGQISPQSIPLRPQAAIW